MHGSLPYDELLHKDVKLIQMLKSIPLPKYIFTNADINHANTCLRIMGLEGLFAVRAETGSRSCGLSHLHSQAWLEIDSAVLTCKGVLQGIVCFESVMKQAGEEGILTKAQPICCKPNRQVCQSS